MSNLKAGDKVRLREGLVEGVSYEHMPWSEDKRFKGVRRLESVVNCYISKLHEYWTTEGSDHWYTPEMLELVSESKPEYPTWRAYWREKYPHGDGDIPCPQTMHILYKCGKGLDCDLCKFREIPPDIARALGIKEISKEG